MGVSDSTFQRILFYWGRSGVPLLSETPPASRPDMLVYENKGPLI